MLRKLIVCLSIVSWAACSSPENSSGGDGPPGGARQDGGGSDSTNENDLEDATLASLSLGTTALSPTFVPGTTMYTAGPLEVSAVFGQTTATVTATPKSSRAALTVNGLATKAGAPSPVVFKSGPNPVDITVTSANARVTKHYTIVATGVTSTASSVYVKASNPQENANFGVALALDGDTLVVGAPLGSGGNGNQNSGNPAGAVYVFTRSETAWTQQAQLVASPSSNGASFGTSVALSGDTLAVGAALDSNAAGAAYVFTRSGTTWSQQAEIKPSNPRDGALFGCSMALAGDTLAVGATPATGLVPDPGAV